MILEKVGKDQKEKLHVLYCGTGDPQDEGHNALYERLKEDYAGRYYYIRPESTPFGLYDDKRFLNTYVEKAEAISRKFLKHNEAPLSKTPRK